jgi:hypothetical protein
LKYPCCKYTLLWSVQLPLLLSFTPAQQLTIHIIISST